MSAVSILDNIHYVIMASHCILKFGILNHKFIVGNSSMYLVPPTPLYLQPSRRNTFYLGCRLISGYRSCICVGYMQLTRDHYKNRIGSSQGCILRIQETNWTWRLLICGKFHDTFLKWKPLLYYWPFMWGAPTSHQSIPHNEGQWCAALIFSLLLVWTSYWAQSSLL